MDPSLVFFMQKAELFRKMRAAEGITVSDETLKYEFTSISISGGIAVVDLVETYSFLINTITEKSTVRTEYHFTFEKDELGNWNAKTIRSNDWFEQEKNGEPFNVESELAEMTVERPEEDRYIANSADIYTSTRSVSNTDYSVNSGRVYNYAKTFWQSYNSGTGMYGNYNSSGGDCMNFASQCLAVGLGFSSDPTSISAGTAPCDSVGTYKWKPHNSAFLSCSSFRSYLSDNTSAGETGLYGTVTESHSSSVTCSAGDILHTEGSGGAYAHAAVVISGGSDRSSIIVSAHNNDRDGVTMAWMCGSAKTCMISHVSGYRTYSNCTGHTYSSVSSGNGTDSICNTCGYSRMQISPATFAPFAKNTTKTISATVSINCYRIAVGITDPDGNTRWLPYSMGRSYINEFYTFSKAGLYTITVSARDINDSLTGSDAKSVVYQVRVTD